MFSRESVTRICLIGVLAVLCLCQQNAEDDEEQIRHPYIASIRSYGSYDCTGVLIGKQTVLTAAQCVDPRYGRSMFPEVWLNNSDTYDLKLPELSKSTKETRFHPNYTGDIFDGYDIAVIILKEPVEDLRQIRLRKGGWNLTAGNELSRLGYGRQSGTDARATLLQITQLTVVPSEKCKATDGLVFLEDQFCAEGNVPCSGDQGGPVFVNTEDAFRDVLVGIVSHTVCEYNIRYAGITFVSREEISDWILEQRDEYEGVKESSLPENCNLTRVFELFTRGNPTKEEQKYIDSCNTKL